MSAYTDFKYDFIQRTLQDINNYTGNYEVTALLNSCVGLLIIPKENLFNVLPTKTVQDFDLETQKLFINDGRHNTHSVKNIVIHIRNSISHGNFQQKSIHNGQIESLEFQDFNPPDMGGNKTFEMIISVDEFKKFAIRVATEVLATR